MKNREAMKNNILCGLSENAVLYRIFSFERFVELLKNKKNTLVQTSHWEDPFENYLLKCTLQLKDGTKVSLKEQHDKWFGQSWTTKNECDGLWRVYTNNKCIRAVKVKTTVKKLFQSFYLEKDELAPLKYFIGKVGYVECNDFLRNISSLSITSPDNRGQVESLLIKRVEFEYEQEVRLLCNVERDQNQSLYQYDIDPNELFDEIMFDPWISNEQRCVFGKIINCLGFSGNVSFSDLYKIDGDINLVYPY